MGEGPGVELALQPVVDGEGVGRRALLETGAVEQPVRRQGLEAIAEGRVGPVIAIAVGADLRALHAAVAGALGEGPAVEAVAELVAGHDLAALLVVERGLAEEGLAADLA